MNSYMNIMVRVGSAKAQAQIAAMSAQMKGLRVETMAMNRVSPFGAAAFSNLIKFGSRLQWVGRQLQYNFTLPILLAGGAAVKFAMDQEKAFTHVSKVYGSISDAQKFFMKQSHGALSATEAHTKAMQAQRNELAALDNAFTAISNQYGVQKKDVDEVAGAWAAAGASGIRLAKSVNLTMQAMIIGDMDAATATQSLISIQAQYNLNSKQLASTLAMLNNVENQTGISMSGLIDGFTRAAGVARAAGVSTKELAAELAALVPATGSAANAGNALKTIYSRLMAPTSDSMDIMKAMGLQIKTTAWQSANAADRLKLMQKAFENLGSSAKNVASSVIASRWQVNKFEVLMDQLGKKTGFYAAALKAAGNETNNFKVMQSELNTVLKSNPRSLARMGVILQNASVKIIQPLIPFIIYLAQELGKLAQAFANLDPHVQKLVLVAAVFLALVGPLVRYLGALKILIGVVGVSTSYLGGALLFLTKVMFGIPFKLLRMGFTLLATAIMSIVPESAAAVGATSLIWRGLIGFFVGWQKAVNAVFAAGNLLRLRIWVTGLISQIMATRTWADPAALVVQNVLA
jgi:TP901 family phage tail tape measure protein